ncbi:MAG TPA: hypothetical protein VGX16_07545 [Solirubrobacteraceae bacterium]|nr:hypothetical protein [Solirubrobacteraceae bacterium]
MSDLLEKVRAEIGERLSELRPRVEEYDRLLAAVEALQESSLDVVIQESPPAALERSPVVFEEPPAAAEAVPESAPESPPEDAPPAPWRPARPARTPRPVAPLLPPRALRAPSLAASPLPERASVLAPKSSALAPRSAKARTAGKRRVGWRAGQAFKLVRSEPGITVTELAAKMKVHANTLYRILPNLELEGKIKRQGLGWHPTESAEEKVPARVGEDGASVGEREAAEATRRGPGRPRGSKCAPDEAADGAPRRSLSGPRRGRPRGGGDRAAQALKLVQEHPGIGIPELAARMEIKQNHLYRVLPELAEEGKVEKQGRGWHPVKDEAA